MAAESKVRKRQAAEGKEAQKESPPGNVWQIGRFRVNLGRIPELLMLFLLAFVVACVGMASFKMSAHIATMSGLFVAVQVQRAGNWLRDWVAYKT
ncbi:unnamed protein product [Symbiodinium necroappetens]|uniref:Uncharacterized protein n=1 Tax=Symbiodinium necroappetens TaxID=1628268 RepID=A0A812K317_9DINO|nr:unnamed protein product [Symbiodinium necroappetens]|mmetsp:Transcript_56581/g.135091  ORF Transcript_56581/g.135091 Transcript_56581/m.135091 type:complete len:95 (+) Transcript_56581:47-331(+)